MQISQAKWEIYYRAAQEREKQRRADLEGRRERAWKLARQAAALLKSEFGASQVAVFGSLHHPERFHLRSDIDLAVWDIKGYFRAVSRLIDLDPEFEFDLVPFEEARLGVRLLRPARVHELCEKINCEQLPRRKTISMGRGAS